MIRSTVRLAPRGARYITNNSGSAETLRVADEKLAQVLTGGSTSGAHSSIKDLTKRALYKSPPGLDAIFPAALKIIEEKSAAVKQQAEELAKQYETTKDQALKDKYIKLMGKAEVHNPQVMMNHVNGNVDMNHPVYRHLAEADYKKYEQILLVESLETMHVIPDTMPVIDAKARVRVNFPGNAKDQWITPGTLQSTELTSELPIVEIQEFEDIPKDSKYTVLLVDPDYPVPETESFGTKVHWAVSNVPISVDQPLVKPELGETLVQYVPSTPEKNSGDHRMSLWVFRQDGDVTDSLSHSDLFDIRGFADKHKLTSVGAFFWRNRFDMFAESLRLKFGLGEGRVFGMSRTGDDVPR